MPKAARVEDELVCVLHKAGVIVEGCPTVMIGFRPAARVEDKVACIGEDTEIAAGCETVMIDGNQAARVGDLAEDGAEISTGFSTVNIGTTPQIQALLMAAALGLPFCEECSPNALAEPSGEP